MPSANAPAAIIEEATRVGGISAAALASIERGVQQLAVQGGDSAAPLPPLPAGDDLSALMATFDEWGFDVFAADRFTDGGALSCVGHAAFISHDLLGFVDQRALAAYLTVVTSSYRNNPYHNAVHAADVAQSTHWFLRVAGFGKSLTKESHIAVLLSAIVHDVAHPGVNNRFLVETWDDIAIQYNDSSVLENFHTAVAFNLMRKEDTAVLALLSSDQRRHIREMMITMILGTDMAKHLALCADFEKRIQDGVMDMEDDGQAILALQVVVHAADISNPAKPWPLYKEWTSRIVTEFFAQVRWPARRGIGAGRGGRCERGALLSAACSPNVSSPLSPSLSLSLSRSLALSLSPRLSLSLSLFLSLSLSRLLLIRFLSPRAIASAISESRSRSDAIDTTPCRWRSRRLASSQASSCRATVSSAASLASIARCVARKLCASAPPSSSSSPPIVHRSPRLSPRCCRAPHRSRSHNSMRTSRHGTLQSAAPFQTTPRRR